MKARVLLVAVASIATLAACESGPERPGGEPPPRGARASLSASASAAASPGPGSAALPPASASAAGAAALAGAWEGSYLAAKGSLSLPDKPDNKAQAADDGKLAIGPGTLELTVLPNGELRGKSKGALGALVLSGRVDEGMVRAQVAPADPYINQPMSGVFVGVARDGAIKGELRVAGPDATVIREAPVTLSKKP